MARQAVADVAEARHRGAGHDDYQFRLSDSVVDATTSGSMARFINHSCAPNCVTRQCAVDGQLHLGIFAARDIAGGEELCYDYKARSTRVRIAEGPSMCSEPRITAILTSWLMPHLIGLCKADTHSADAMKASIAKSECLPHADVI